MKLEEINALYEARMRPHTPGACVVGWETVCAAHWPSLYRELMAARALWDYRSAGDTGEWLDGTREAEYIAARRETDK